MQKQATTCCGCLQPKDSHANWPEMRSRALIYTPYQGSDVNSKEKLDKDHCWSLAVNLSSMDRLSNTHPTSYGIVTSILIFDAVYFNCVMDTQT